MRYENMRTQCSKTWCNRLQRNQLSLQGRKILAFALAVVMLIAGVPVASPVTVQAAGTIGIQAGKPMFSTGDEKTVVNFAGHEWFVIDDGDDGVTNPGSNHITLLGKNNDFGAGNAELHAAYDNISPYLAKYEDSTLHGIMEDIYYDDFESKEQKLISERTIDNVWDGVGPSPNWDSELANQYLWPLSYDEHVDMGSISNDEFKNVFFHEGCFWLRSPNYYYGDHAWVGLRGGGNPNFINAGHYNMAVRPALNLNLEFVFFTSAASEASGKSSATVGSGLVTAGDHLVGASAPMKFTVLDIYDGDTNTTGQKKPNLTLAGTTDGSDNIRFGYSGATTGDNQYLSCILKKKDEETIKYYGKLADCQENESGVLTLPIDGVESGEYDLELFCEQANGELHTDFAGEPVKMILEVSANHTATVEGNGNAFHTDSTAPTGKITIGTNNEFTSFHNTNTFSQFSKNTVRVEVDGQDDDSGINKVEYIKSGLSYESSDEIVGDWTDISDSGEFDIDPDWKGYIYARITDNVCYSTIIRSDGVAVYSDSEQDTESIRYTKGNNTDKDATVTLNGNTIEKIKNGDRDLAKDTDYSISGETITFKATYLESLTSDDYTLTVHYNPQGVTPAQVKAGVTFPVITTTIGLTVSKATTTITVTPPENITYGETLENPSATAEKGVGTFTYRYTGTSADNSLYDSASKPTLPGSYTVTATFDSDTHTGSGNADFTIEGKTLSWNADGTVQDKDYDGTTAAAIENEPTLNGMITGDTIAIVTGTVRFSRADIGIDIPIIAEGWEISGTDAWKYNAPTAQPIFAAGAIRDIHPTPKPPSPTDKIISHTVTLRGEGGKFANGKSTQVLYVAENKKIGKLASPKRKGYQFTGWYTKKTGGTKINKNLVIKKNQTFYAHWASVKKVTLRGSGGKFANGKSSQVLTVKKNKKIGKLAIPKRKGYQFMGWYTVPNKDGKVSSNSKAVKKNLIIKKNRTFYAHWARIGYVHKAAYLYLRMDAGIKHSIQHYYPKDTKVLILAEKAGWYQVKVGKNTGWMYGEYIRLAIE